MASDRAVLHGNDVFSILVVSSKKQYSSYLKKVFVFQKICLKVKVLKTFESFTDCHVKNMLISQTEGYFESPYYICRITYALFVGFKMETKKKRFQSLRQKPPQVLP